MNSFGCESYLTRGFQHDIHGYFAYALIAFLILLIFIALLHKNRERSKYASDSSDSLKILKDRLARGEITLAEYDTLKNVL